MAQYGIPYSSTIAVVLVTIMLSYCTLVDVYKRQGEVLSYASDTNKFDGLYSVYGEDTKCPGWELTSGLVWARITAQSAAAQLLKK